MALLGQTSLAMSHGMRLNKQVMPMRLGNTMYKSNIAFKNVTIGNVRRSARIQAAQTGIVCSAAPAVEASLA